MNLFIRVLIIASMLIMLGLMVDTRRSVDKLSEKTANGFDDIRKDFTRYLTTGECGQFLDNNKQLGGPAK